jgi:uncharacterized integral membrane protein
MRRVEESQSGAASLQRSWRLRPSSLTNQPSATRRFRDTGTCESEAMAQAARPEAETQTSTAEPRGERLRRGTRRVGLYTWALLLLALLVVLVALVVANTREVEVSWVLGSTRQSLVWIILAAAIVGWLAGVVTSVLFRRRTRRGH